MIDSEDKLIGQQEIEILTVRRRKVSDLVIVTEKCDGMNCSVLKRDNLLYPLVRKGYDCRTNPYNWIQAFADFVKQNEERYQALLSNEERICGEWMIKTHTLQYRLPHEPFIVFDLIRGSAENQTREGYLKFRERISAVDFTPAGLIHMGESIPTDMALSLLGKGYHGVIGDPEGVVYRYEDSTGRFLAQGKFVSNPLLGNDELFRSNDSLFNKWKGNYRFYGKE